MPATPTYVALAEVTLAATAASVTLPVPSGFRDLILVYQGQTSAINQPLIRFNSDSGTNYSYVSMLGYAPTNTLSQSGTDTGIVMKANSGTANSTYLSTIQIMDYSATDKHKSVLIRLNNGNSGPDIAEATAQRWANTAAITSISIGPTSGTMNTGTTLNLYGIEA